MRTRILRSYEDAARLAEILLNASLVEPWRVIFEPYRKRRSLAQNALLHMWMTEVSKQWYEATGEKHLPDVWKEYLKRQFLGVEVTKIRGATIERTRRTRDLTVSQMSEFLNNIDHYCGAELGIQLPYPDVYQEAMGR